MNAISQIRQNPPQVNPVLSDQRACKADNPHPGNIPARRNAMATAPKCHHMLSGQVSYKLCWQGYDCDTCPYDQMMEDVGLLPTSSQAQCENVAGFDVARNYYYHTGHTWARIEYGGRVRVGLDDFAQRLLGPQEKIELPRLGRRVRQNEPFAVLRRGKKSVELRSPVDGTVLAVNTRLRQHADIANADPFNDGWLVLVQPSALHQNLKSLLSGNDSLAWIDDQSNQLSLMVNKTTKYAYAFAGAEVVRDICGTLPELDWDELVERFFQ